MFIWHVSRANLKWPRGRFVNGLVSASYRLPGVTCPICGPWAWFKNLTVECPASLRTELKTLFDEHPNIPLAEFRRLKSRWEESLRKLGVEIDLQPGNAFQPLTWDVPSIPRFDIFWTNYSVVFSERLVKVLKVSGAAGVELSPIQLGRIGDFEAADAPPIPESGEYDEEYFQKMHRVRDTTKVGKFFSVVITDYTPGRSVLEDGIKIEKCETCGLESFDDSEVFRPRRDAFREKGVLPRRYWVDKDFFESRIYYDGFLVSERLRQAIPDAFLTNCQVRRIEVIDD